MTVSVLVALVVASLAPPALAAPGGVTLAEAITSALTNNPSLQSDRQQLELAKGDRLTAQAPFDFSVNTALGHQRIYTPFTPDVFQLDNTTRLALSARKQLPFGLSIEPSVELLRRDSVIPAVVSGTVAPQNIALVRLQVRQPLLRGFGSGTSAQVDAAPHLVRAAEHDVRFATTTRVVQVARIYWAYVGAQKNVEALKASQARAQRLIEETKQLVDADQRPAADLLPLQASYAQRTRDRLSAELSAFAIRAELGLQMGLRVAQIDALGDPISPLPKPGAQAALPSPEAVVARRDDVLAAKERLEVTRILVDAAENATLPQLDLVGEIGYAGIVQGTNPANAFSALGSNIPGVSVGASLVLQWPVQMSAGRGALTRAVASRRQAELARLDAARRAAVQLRLAAQQIDVARRALLKAQETLALQRSAADNERTKLRNGLATLIDVIVVDDRTTAAELAEAQTHVAYAQALADAAFARADLLQGEGAQVEVNLGRLASQP